MAKDIKLSYDQDTGTGNFTLNNGDFDREEGFETAVNISLFTNRRADIYDNIDDFNDKRGWWGDTLSDVQEDKIGSKLWLIERMKTTDEVLELTQQYALEALEWMVDDEVCQTIEVDVTREGTPGNDILNMEVRIFKFDESLEVFKFNDLWESQLGV
jgi:phage gp46-like protein